MKVKLISAFLLGVSVLASSLSPAAAVQYNGATVYKATENGITTVYIDGTAGNKVAVDLGQLSKTTSKLAAACGDVKISIPKGNTNFTGLMVDGTAVNYANLPIRGKYSEAVTRSKVAIEMLDWRAFQAFKIYLNTPVRKISYTNMYCLNC